MIPLVIFGFLAAASGEVITANNVPPYVKQCHEGDPNIIECFKGSLHHLQPYLKTGIPEIELPSVEPFLMDELSLSLTSGPNGYRVSLKDIDVFGASNFTVETMKLGEGDKPFEALIRIPELRINAKYQSTGVLIILPASGSGTFHGLFDGVTATVKGRVSSTNKGEYNYLHVDSLHVDLDIKKVKMAVKKIFNNNRILIEATNLFLRENGQEVIKAMSPQLTKKLSNLFKNIANKLLTHVPVEVFYVPQASKANN